MTATEALRKQIKKNIDKADDILLHKVSAVLEINQNRNEWWKDEEFVKELDRMHEAMESGAEKGITLEELKISIEAIRVEMYGK